MKELRKELENAASAYYNGNPIMSDLEFDKKSEQLKQLEGKDFSVGAKVTTGKIRHEYPALSLDKVKYKEKEKLASWLSSHGESVVMWKMDGSTICATYDNGKLHTVATRGDGYEGKDITSLVKEISIEGLPLSISYLGHLVVRGECVMKNSEFERLNSSGEFANARNLANATLQMDDFFEAKKRKLCFYGFELVFPDAKDISSMKKRLAFLHELGFSVVDFEPVHTDNLLSVIEKWKENIHDNDFPTDGLVFAMDDMEKGISLGNTGHHPRHSIALKWTDETATTTLRSIEWSVGKTGVVTPVAVFDTVNLGLGSDVRRASLHNVSILRNLPLGDGKEPIGNSGMCIGDKVEVYLANMIIPQIYCYHYGDNRTSIEIPKTCPICGSLLRHEDRNGVVTIHCDNPDCDAKKIGLLMNTFSKDGLFIKGLGESQLVDLLESTLVTSDPVSFYDLERAYTNFTNNPYKNLSEPGYLALKTLLDKDGWGQKKWDNLMNAIRESKKTTLSKFLYSLNIPMCGNDLSKKIASYFSHDENKFRDWILLSNELISEEIKNLDGIGEVKFGYIRAWIDELHYDSSKLKNLMDLMDFLSFDKPTEGSSSSSLSGLTFVITGILNSFANRDALISYIEERGGKVSGSVSKKTSFLINNDTESSSGKNKKAKELGISIISEEDFMNTFN